MTILALSILLQVFLVVLVIPLSWAWCLSFIYWIDFRTVWQMIYKAVPLAVLTALFALWLSAFESAGNL